MGRFTKGASFKLEVIRDLIEALPLPALLLDGDAIVVVNGDARRLLGCAAPEGPSVEEILRGSELAAKLAASSTGEVTITSANNEFLGATVSKRVVEVGDVALRVVILSSIGSRASRDARRARRVLDVCRVGVYEHDYLSDEFYGSPLLRQMYGFSSEQELTLQTFRGAFHPGDRERVISEILKSRDPKGDGVFDSLIRIIRPDGEVRWIQSRAVTEFGEVNGELRPLLCTGSVRDVTSRVQLAMALERSEERYTTALFASRIGIYDIDHCEKDETRGNYWSPTLLAICGLAENAKPSLACFMALVHPADVSLIESAWARALSPEGDGRFSLEHRIVLSDGEVRWSRATSQTYFREVDGCRVPIRTIGAVLDITENKQREVEWSRSSAILDATPDLVSITDLQGNPVYLNQAGRAFLNLGAGEQPTPEIMRAAHPGSERERVAEEGVKIAIQKGSWKAETEFCDAQGNAVPMSLVIVAHRGVDGDVEHISAIARDLSREKDLERRYLHAQKMEAVGRLAGGIAHDFNNVLSVITGFTSLALKTLPEGRAQQSLDEVLRAAGRASDLTSQLLAFSTKQIRRPKVFCLNDILEDLKPMVARLLDESISFEFLPCSPAPFIKADPSQIEQALLNLAVNARDAMPEGGRLILKTRLVEGECPEGGHSRRWVTIGMSDTGHGMDAATQERIFEPFFTTKGPGKGSGLGLATVFGVVQQSGGDIRVRSQLGGGTTFEIHLPCTDELPSAEEPPGRSVRVKQRTAVILLVEDDSSLRSMIATCLRQAGHSVLVASNANDAVLLAAQHAKSLDLLLTDVVMPNMNGRELSQRVVKAAPGVSVLFMSGYTEDAIVHRGVLDIDVNFLPKPFTPDELTDAVQAALQGERSAVRSA